MSIRAVVDRFSFRRVSDFPRSAYPACCIVTRNFVRTRTRILAPRRTVAIYKYFAADRSRAGLGCGENALIVLVVRTTKERGCEYEKLSCVRNYAVTLRCAAQRERRLVVSVVERVGNRAVSEGNLENWRNRENLSNVGTNYYCT